MELIIVWLKIARWSGKTGGKVGDETAGMWIEERGDDGMVEPSFPHLKAIVGLRHKWQQPVQEAPPFKQQSQQLVHHPLHLLLHHIQCPPPLPRPTQTTALYFCLHLPLTASYITSVSSRHSLPLPPVVFVLLL
ncbi:hypothetical protein GOP47_0029523 [Adiantum capillus-veneris]|nr:hypothetical protein GOP47_0029523 [Adiantum capillus-veneris]